MGLELVQWQMQTIHGLATHGGVWWIWSWIQQKQPVEFDGFGTVANAKHPWLGYTQSWIQQKQPVEFDGFGTVANANAKHPWLGYTQSWIQQKQPVQFDGFGTQGYMLYSLGYTVEYWIQQNQAKPGEGFWRIWVVRANNPCVLWPLKTLLNSFERWAYLKKQFF